MATNKYPRGSEWHKWGLHVHTPKSICNNCGGVFERDGKENSINH